MPNRDELERAIELQRKRIAFEDDIYPKNIDEFILTVLVAELSRQETAPLTCEGCKREFNSAK